jgi:hypothetical protein
MHNKSIDEDPIEAIHRTRESIAKKFNYNMKEIFADVMKRQQKERNRQERPEEVKIQG